MRILLFLPDFRVYEERVLAYMKGTEDAEKVVVMTPFGSRVSTLVVKGLPPHWEVQYLPQCKKYLMGSWIKKHTVRIIRSFEMDIVHDHFYYLVTAFGRISKLSFPPILAESLYIYNRQWLEMTRWNLPVWSINTDLNRLRNLRAEWQAVKRADYLILQSELLKDGIELHYKRVAGQILCIPNAVDHETYRPGEGDRSRFGIPRDRLIIVSVGYVGFRKGTDIALLALSMASRKDPRLCLVFAGEIIHAEERNIRSLVAKLGLTDKIYFLGNVCRRDLSELYRCADMFLLTSCHEGMPRVVLEAMSSGLPVIASNLPGVRAIDPEGRCIITTLPGETEKIAESFVYLASDSKERQARGWEGRAIVETGHTIDKVGKRIAEMYRSMMRARN